MDMKDQSMSWIKTSTASRPEGTLTRDVGRAVAFALLYIGDQMGRIADALKEKDTSSDGKKSALDV